MKKIADSKLVTPQNPNGLKLLLVEDDRITALNTAMQLRSNGFDVVVAASGERALALVKDSRSFDLILMDIDLGDGLDGIQTAGLLNHLNIPVIYLSSRNRDDLVNSGRICRDAPFISKGTSFESVLASISNSIYAGQASQA